MASGTQGSTAATRLSAVAGRWVVALGLFAAAAIVAGTVWTLWRLQTYELQHGTSRLRDLATVLASQSARAVHGVDLILRHAADDALESLDRGDPRAGAAALRDKFLQHIALAPHVRSIILTDAAGRAIVHAALHAAPEVSYADREHFLVHRSGVIEGLHIARPTIGRVSGEVAHPISRAVHGKDGRFLGIVIASIQPKYFEELYRTLDLGPGATISLTRRDGTILAAYPMTERPPGELEQRDDALAPAFERAEPTLISHADALNGEPRVSVVHPVRDYPLFVTVSATETTMLGDYRRQALTVAPFSAATALFLAGLALLLGRELRTDASLRRDLTAAEERWRFAVEGAGHGVWDWDIHSNTVRRSEAHCRLLGLPAESPSDQQALLARTHPDDRQHLSATLSAITRGDLATFSHEVRIRDAQGDGWHSVLLRGMVVARDSQGRPLRFIGTTTDVSDLRRAEARVVEEEVRHAAVLASAMDAIITVDADQRVVMFNQAAERIFGVNAREAIGGSLDRFLPERFRAAHRGHIERFDATGVTTRRMGGSTVLVGLRADGEEFPIDASISQVSVRAQKYFTVILRDITARVRQEREIAEAQRDLRELSKAAHEALEAERRHVARELHDELGQSLTAIKMDLAQVEGILPAGRTDLRERCDRIRGLVDQTVAATRRISADLRPLLLDDLGLAAALDWLTEDVARRTGIVVTLAVDESLAEIGDPQASAIFRIVQESLTNVTRHAEASRVTIKVTEDDGQARISVQDDGKGIAAAARAKRGSFGLRGMRERARLLGGDATVEQHALGGTVVNAHLALAPVPSDEVLG